jgi:hypothetical protein
MNKIESPYIREMVRDTALVIYQRLLEQTEGDHSIAHEIALAMKTLNDGDDASLKEVRAFYEEYFNRVLPSVFYNTIEYIIENHDEIKNFADRQCFTANGVIEECKKISKRAASLFEKEKSVIVEE